LADADSPALNLEAVLAAVEAAAADADASLTTDLGASHEQTPVRLWRGQVLVDWEPDERAGDCLFRPTLLRRLVALHAGVALGHDRLKMDASGRVVAALSATHADLVRRLGGPRRVDLHLRLRFDNGVYLGGDETYFVLEHGRRAPLLSVKAEVRVRSTRAASPRT
jgi:hypothetical protein